jgi:cell division protein FtsN
MNKQFFHLIFLLLLSASAFAQPNKKVGPALSKFLNTEFMVKYRDLRIEAESAAIGVQSRKDQMKTSDIFRLRTAYDQTASRANQLIEGVKQDFLNGKKLKSIAEFPEMYSDGLRYKLQDLSDFYAANFQQVLADASAGEDEEIVGSAVLLLVVELIGLTKGLTNYFAEIKREARQYTEAHLQENLVQPYRWRYWDELSGSASPYEKFEKSSELNINQPRTEDPLDQQLQKMNQAISNFPINDNAPGNSNQDFELPQENNFSSDSTSFKYEDWSPTEPNPAQAKQQATTPASSKALTKPETPAAKSAKPAAPTPKPAKAPAKKDQ